MIPISADFGQETCTDVLELDSCEKNPYITSTFSYFMLGTPSLLGKALEKTLMKPEPNHSVDMPSLLEKTTIFFDNFASNNTRDQPDNTSTNEGISSALDTNKLTCTKPSTLILEKEPSRALNANDNSKSQTLPTLSQEDKSCRGLSVDDNSKPPALTLPLPQNDASCRQLRSVDKKAQTPSVTQINQSGKKLTVTRPDDKTKPKKSVPNNLGINLKAQSLQAARPSSSTANPRYWIDRSFYRKHRPKQVYTPGNNDNVFSSD